MIACSNIHVDQILGLFAFALYMSDVLLLNYSNKFYGFIYLRSWLIYFSSFLEHISSYALKQNEQQNKKKTKKLWKLYMYLAKF